MKKICILLSILLLCGCLASCNKKHQCVEIPDESYTPPILSSEEESSKISNDENSEETSAESSPDIKIAPDGYIDAVVNDYREDFVDEKAGIHIIKDHSELMKFYELAEFAITDSYEEDYFDDKAVIFVLLYRGSGSCMLDIKHLKIDNGILTITITDRMPEVGTDDEQRRVFAIEVSQEDIKGIEKTELVIEDVNVIMLFEESEPNKVEDFSEKNFSGTVERSEELMMIKNYHWLELITDKHELDTLAERYSYDGNGENMLDFINNLKTDFFDTKAIIALPYTLDMTASLNPTPAYWLFSIINYEQEGLTLYFRETMKSVDGGGIRNVVEGGINLIIVDKSILPKNNVYNVVYVFDDIWEIE